MVLDLKNIQGDILEGFPKKAQTFLFFEITKKDEFLKKLKDVIPFITTAEKVQSEMKDIKAHRDNGEQGLLTLKQANIAFSAKGLNMLGIKDKLGDDLFDKGQLADAAQTFASGGIDDPRELNAAEPDWDLLFKKDIHGSLIVAGESQITVNNHLKTVMDILTGTIRMLGTESGTVRSGDQAGHEHFGFQDGVSNPPIDTFRTPDTGEDKTPPGIILLGEEGDENRSSIRQGSWKDSSFLVFRKLSQKVPEFNKFLEKPPTGLTPEQFGAKLVGRWPSGAPVVNNPTNDNLADAADPNKVNNFDYHTDETGKLCPFAAHLRKMNPRAGIPGLAEVRKRRIMRQGIPYGPEVTFEEMFNKKSDPKFDRGLLFVCYQSVLANGFHFLQRTWANNPSFPQSNIGFDAIIGQQGTAQRSISGINSNNLNEKIELPNLFVVPKGGEYFISPSISALEKIFVSTTN